MAPLNRTVVQFALESERSSRRRICAADGCFALISIPASRSVRSTAAGRCGDFRSKEDVTKAFGVRARIRFASAIVGNFLPRFQVVSAANGSALSRVSQTG